jgi:hypothetical protein
MKGTVLSLLIMVAQMLLCPSALAQAPQAPPEPFLSLSVIAVGVLVLLIVAGLAMFAISRSSRSRENKSSPIRTMVRESGTLGSLERQTTVPADARQERKCVFVSYRREDSADITGRIYDRLAQHFGKDFIFKDVDSIPLGIDFRQHLERAVGQCSVLLAIIGRGWLETGMESGKRRLDDPRDHLRIEIEAALKREVPVIPVLAQGAAIPPEQDLPPSLQSLAYRNAVAVRTDPDFHGDMDRLIRGIQAHLR